MLGNDPKEMLTEMNLRIVHLNARSLPCHFVEVQSFVLSQHPDILAITETWLDLSMSDPEVSLSGYQLSL